MLPLPSLVLLNYSKHHLLFSLSTPPLSVCIYPQPRSSSSHVDRRAICPAFSIHANTFRDTVHRRMSQTWQIDNTARRIIHLQHVWCVLCVDTFSTVWRQRLPTQPEYSWLIIPHPCIGHHQTPAGFYIYVFEYMLYIFFLVGVIFWQDRNCNCDLLHYNTFGDRIFLECENDIRACEKAFCEDFYLWTVH